MFQQIKATTDIMDVLEHYGLKFRNKKAFCPFHNDKKTPNLTVSKSKQIFRCHHCGVAGDSIKFVANLFDISNLDAAKKIINDLRLAINVGTQNLRDRIIYRNALVEKEIKRKRQNEQIENALKHYKLLKSIMANSVPMSEEWCYAANNIDLAEYKYDCLIGCDE
jgi:DNA primase